jgi:hypothetical protein
MGQDLKLGFYSQKAFCYRFLKHAVLARGNPNAAMLQMLPPHSHTAVAARSDR